MANAKTDNKTNAKADAAYGNLNSSTCNAGANARPDPKAYPNAHARPDPKAYPNANAKANRVSDLLSHSFANVFNNY
jgi:hypothetical protein